jgi:hypothetical protein
MESPTDRSAGCSNETVDRSGSMQDIRSDAEGGVNAFIENQAKEPGNK